MQLTPLIAVHMTAAIGAVVIGPFALWARMGSIQLSWPDRHPCIDSGHVGQLMGRFSRHRQKRLRHTPHHHAVFVCGRMPDCRWVYLATLTLFRKLDLACVVGVVLIHSTTQNYQTSSFKRCFGMFANALSRLTKVAFRATAWAAIIMSKSLRLMPCDSKLLHSSP